MRLSPLIISLTILVSPCFAFADNNKQDINEGLKIIYGNKNPVCLDAATLIQGLPRNDWVSDRWPKAFGGTEWSPTEVSGFGYTVTDIYNNGSSVVILGTPYYSAIERLLLKTVDSFVNMRTLFVMQPEDFQQIQKSKQWVMHELLKSKLSQLSPNNQVKFTNGKSTAPLWSNVWRYESKNYIVMEERSFGMGAEEDERYFPGSFYVGILDSDSNKYDPDYKVMRLTPQMICRLTWSNRPLPDY